jgi:hypothetical protein
MPSDPAALSEHSLAQADRASPQAGLAADPDPLPIYWPPIELDRNDDYDVVAVRPSAAVQALEKVNIKLPEAVQHGLLHRRCVNLRRCLLDLPSADNVRLPLQATFPWAESSKNEFDPVVPCLGQMTA